MATQLKRARFRFYGQLNDFLPLERRHVSFDHAFEIAGNTKDMIEALGVPHTEIELILVNGRPVDFSSRVLDGDRVSVYPSFRSIDISRSLTISAAAPGEPKFVADTHLGKLAASLRMLGFDTYYQNDSSDEALVEITNVENRMLLTRDVGILKRSAVKHGYFVRATHFRQQLLEVLERFSLFSATTPFQRCMRCNARLQQVAKDLIVEQLPPKVRSLHSEFHLCPNCGRLYWKGTHYCKMQQWIARLLASQPGAADPA